MIEQIGEVLLNDKLNLVPPHINNGDFIFFIIPK